LAESYERFATSGSGLIGCVAFPRGRRFPRGSGTSRRRTGRSVRAANLSTFVRSRMTGSLTLTAATGSLTAAVVFVHCRPGATLGFLVWHPAVFVAFCNMIRLAFLLLGVFRFVSAWHWFRPFALGHANGRLMDQAPVRLHPDMGLRGPDGHVVDDVATARSVQIEAGARQSWNAVLKSRWFLRP
jgi:hypothetical protein